MVKVQGKPRVAIIGGGISGLAAAKELRDLEPVVFEATDSIGGVWKHCSFRTTRLQTPRPDYEFTDHQWDDRNDPTFPTHTEILNYLHGFATRFDLWKLIRLRAKVVEVRFIGGGGSAAGCFTELWGENGKAIADRPVWEVGVVTGDSDSVQRFEFEFVVMCMGKYGDVANIPRFPDGKGPEIFQGQVLHTMDYCKLDQEAATRLMKGKKVVVVGYKKSAIDLAVECAEANQGADGEPCTMVIRTLHWTVPSYSIWGLPFFLFFSTRFSQFLHERPNRGLVETLACRLLSPLRKGVSKFIESYLAWKLPLDKYGLRPDHPFLEDYASCQMAILPENFFAEADRGLIRFKRANQLCFWEGGVTLESDGNDCTKLEADVVLLATGYDGKTKLTSVLPGPYRGLVVDSSGVMPLYRGTIHPLIPHMAFVGYIESVSNLHTSELRCKWLGSLVKGEFELPAVEEMFRQIREEVDVMKRTTRFYRRHCISTFSIAHSDGMCQDMGWRSWRKTNWFAEAFAAYGNQDYIENGRQEEEDD
ncbi:probable flavin-containing monooxygenase 1 [Zingiber officinale]|uniref:probable flavin-containing monooxygenase 1 n=1 Tax=Zingiber officinale TaxID=94328 RepID=UPI001C4D1D55|nr:probable flavin-containing monooxygenase 1 [Zingiber officinale]